MAEREHRIEIRIDEQGRITAEAHGFTGDVCVREMEKLLAEASPGCIKLERKQPDQQGHVAAKSTQQLRPGSQP